MIGTQGIPEGGGCEEGPVRLPKEFQFSTKEVFIRREGDQVILSPRPTDWGAYFTDGPVASADFMEGVEELPVQERDG